MMENDDVSWNTNSINELIKYFESCVENDRLEQETSSFPEGEEESIQKNEACIELLIDMKDKKSWFYKNFNK